MATSSRRKKRRTPRRTSSSNCNVAICFSRGRSYALVQVVQNTVSSMNPSRQKYLGVCIAYC
jgi:hypothetical protein